MTPKLWPARIWWVWLPDIAPCLYKVPKWTPVARCLRPAPRCCLHAYPPGLFWACVGTVGIRLPCSLDHPVNTSLRPNFRHPFPTLYFSRGWSICEAYTCSEKEDWLPSVVIILHILPLLTEPCVPESRIPIFFKLAYVFKRNLSGLRSTFLSIMKLRIMFWCGMQAATIFKHRHNCTCHLLTVERFRSKQQRGWWLS